MFQSRSVEEDEWYWTMMRKFRCHLAMRNCQIFVIGVVWSATMTRTVTFSYQAKGRSRLSHRSLGLGCEQVHLI